MRGNIWEIDENMLQTVDHDDKVFGGKLRCTGVKVNKEKIKVNKENIPRKT